MSAHNPPTFVKADPRLGLPTDARDARVDKGDVHGNDTFGQHEDMPAEHRSSWAHGRRRRPPGNDLIEAVLHVGDTEPQDIGVVPEGIAKAEGSEEE